MFAVRDRPPGSCANHAALRRYFRSVTLTARHANAVATCPTALSLRAERRNTLFAFSTLPTLFLAQKLQPSLFQQVPHFLNSGENATAVFTATSALFARPSARERKSTPLLSFACALFRENIGGTPIATERRPTLEEVAAAPDHRGQTPERSQISGQSPPQPWRRRVDLASQWCYTPTRLQIVSKEKKCVDLPI
jgi:hypothetical protein